MTRSCNEFGVYNRTAEIIECAHQPLLSANVMTGEQVPLERLRDTFIGSICAIAAPESFEDDCANSVRGSIFPRVTSDHHRYSEAELHQFHQSLHSAGLGDDRDDREGCGAHSASDRSE